MENTCGNISFLTDEELKISYYRIYNKLIDTVWNVNNKKIVDYFTNHGEYHTKCLIDIINEITENDRNVTLTNEEYYILYISACLHDIGLQCNYSHNKKIYKEIQEECNIVWEEGMERGYYSVYNQKLIRKFHSLFAYKWIINARTDKEDILFECVNSIPRKLFNSVLNVIRAHSNYKLELFKESENTIVRERMLAYLFRIVDELDIGEHRISEGVLNSTFIPTENSKYWYLNLISAIRISKNNVITMEIYLSAMDYRKYSNDFKNEFKKFDNKNRILFDKLSVLGIHISFSVYGSKVIQDYSYKNIPNELLHELLGEKKYSIPEKNLTTRNICCALLYNDEKDIYIERRRLIRTSLVEQSNNILSVEQLELDDIHINEVNWDKYIQVIVLLSFDIIKILKDEESILNKVIDLKYEKEFFDIKFICLDDHKDEYKKNLKKILYSDVFDMSKIQLDSNNNIIRNELDFKTEIDNIISKAYGSAYHNELTKDSFINSIYKSFMIASKDEEIYLPIGGIVTTNAYKEVSTPGRRKFLILGRKGSGKTTVINTLKRLNGAYYKGFIPIKADEIELKDLYFNINGKLSKKIESYLKDLSGLVSEEDVLGFIWRVFLYQCTLAILYKKYEEGKLSSRQANNMEKMLEDVKNIQRDIKVDQNGELSIRQCLNHSVNLTIDYLDVVVEESFKCNTWDAVSSFVKYKFDFNQFVNYQFESIDIYFRKILDECTKNILITVDDFNSNVEFVKLENEIQIEKSIQFETLWLSTIIDSVLESMGKIKNPQNKHLLFKKLDYCICIPQDRFYEYRLLQRDGIRFSNLWIDIRWSGIELAEVLIKRLSVIFNDLKEGLSELDDTESKLQFCLKNKCPLMPMNLNIITNNDKHLTIGLFQYILRKSFWRPRDIILYYSKIITTAFNFEKGEINNPVALETAIKRDISLTSKYIIENEFINEFRFTFPNLHQVINCFFESEIIIGWDDLFKRISSVNMQMTNYANGIIENEIEKVKVLFKLGFLGIQPTEILRRTTRNDCDFVFSFLQNIDDNIFVSGEIEKCKFMIHPIFTDYLILDYNTDDLICNYDWGLIQTLSAER